MLTDACKKDISSCTDKELYADLLYLVNKLSRDRESAQSKKESYYISAEFLIGGLLSDNMINLRIYSQMRSVLASHGKNLCVLEELEPEPSLGNGGLGRLAAYFLDSIATLGPNGDGIGLNYYFGLFKQLPRDNLQNKEPNSWMENTPWLNKASVAYQIPYRNSILTSWIYDIEATSHGNCISKLHPFDAEIVDESLVKNGVSLDKTNIGKDLTLFFYPDDSNRAGQMPRIHQQYFMASDVARLVLSEAAAKGSTPYGLPDYAAIQTNNIHPTIVVPELIRLLTTEHGMEMDDAIQVVMRTCAHISHTILAEALETWPTDYFKEAVPQPIPIMEAPDNKVRRKFDDSSVCITDKDDRAHMIHIDIHYGFSVDDVAALHTDILKENELNNFYGLYSEKFNNKTNDIIFRRWLLHCNPQLTDYILALIGDSPKKDAFGLKRLDDSTFTANMKILHHLLVIKDSKKQELTDYLKEVQDIDTDPELTFDIQIKCLHECKHQQMSTLYLIHKYLEIKWGSRLTTPIIVIFGAKAASAYTIVGDIIHMILCLRQVIDNDPDVRPWLSVAMVNNYNASLIEKLIPACDISKQIFLASKEVSDTNNTKFVLSGAVTLSTGDGANVEIHELAGDDSIYIFGESSETVIRRYAEGGYCSRSYYEVDPDLKEAVGFIISPAMAVAGFREHLERLYNELLNKNWFMTLPNSKDYCRTRKQTFNDYESRTAWAREMSISISKAGHLSFDRATEKYNRDIWKLDTGLAPQLVMESERLS